MTQHQSFQNLIDHWGINTPDHEAIFDGTRRISYGELFADICKVSHFLAEMGIKKGDKMITFIPNWYEFIILFFAFAKLGAILIPCHANILADELETQIERIRPKAVFITQPDFLSVLKAWMEPKTIFTIRFREQGCQSFADILETAEPIAVKSADINPLEDPFMIMFTSGTSGVPKGVVSTYNGMLKTAQNLGANLQCTSEDVFLVQLPTAHMFGTIVGILLPFSFGGKIVLIEKHSPTTALTLIEQEKITVHYGVPTMFVTELEEIRHNPRQVSSLRTGIIAGAAVPRHLREQVNTEFQCKIMVAYGSTESIAVSCTNLNDPLEMVYETVGKPLGGYEVKVIDDHGNVQSAGQIGELLCRGYGLMKSYYEMPVETGMAIDKEGWYHSGDLAVIDEFGYIRIVGRRNDFIKRGGNKVYPQEIEGFYSRHPHVLHICVKGHPDSIMGEITFAYIALRDNCTETEESLRNYAMGKISKYKIPDRFVLLEKMPMLENGKINKQALTS